MRQLWIKKEMDKLRANMRSRKSVLIGVSCGINPTKFYSRKGNYKLNLLN
jgi:hypothetical protein